MGISKEKADDIDRKFRITARLFQSLMDAMEKLHGNAKRCQDDVDGIAVLMGVKENNE